MIKIKDNNIELKYTIRALFIFEQITSRAFSIKTITDTYIFLYSVILASNPNINLTFEELIEECDSNPTLMEEFNKFLLEYNNKNKVFNTVEQSTDKKKD